MAASWIDWWIRTARSEPMTVRRQYSHQQWEPIRRILKFLIRNVGYRILAKFDSVEGLENIPPQGPVIVMYNHIAFIDPVAVLSTSQRDMVPLAKTEALGVPFFGIFARLWGVIPIRRGEVDREALETSFQVLRAGEILLVAPEGHRNPALQPAKDGIAYLAARSGAPIIPAAVEGTEGFPTLNPARWRKPGVRIRFGRLFRFKDSGGRASRERLHEMTEDAMYRLAEILPPERRGFYRDLSQAKGGTIAPDAG
jgi:1-acyl-sn-glycerol-3-phosphate acyltransferase